MCCVAADVMLVLLLRVPCAPCVKASLTSACVTYHVGVGRETPLSNSAFDQPAELKPASVILCQCVGTLSHSIYLDEELKLTRWRNMTLPGFRTKCLC